MPSAAPTLREALRAKYRTLFGTIGSVIALVGIAHLLPLTILPFYPQEIALWPCFATPACLGIIAGGGLWWQMRSRQEPYELSVQDGSILVILVWAMTMLLGALPFWLSHSLSPLNALFESVSGWSTTGLSVLDIPRTAKVLLFWRSLTQYFGALGVVLIALVAIIGTSAQSLYLAEGRSDLLRPHIRRTVKLIAAIYASLTAITITLYRISGMNLFDALNHAMCTVSTGGFSTYAESYAHWDSWKLEVMTIALMFVAATHYTTHFSILRGDWRAALRNREWRLAGGLLLCAIPLIFLSLTALPEYGWSLKSLRTASFEAMAALSTTGFTSTRYQNWPDLALFALTILMLIGGGTGSTAGGIKQYRVYLLLKAVGWELRKRLLPRRAVVKHQVWTGSQWQEIDAEELVAIAAFVVFYLLAYAVGVMTFVACGYNLRDSLFEMASSISTIGLSVGITSPTAPALIRITQMAAMALGRLEFFVVIFGLARLLRDYKLMRGNRRARTARPSGHPALRAGE